MLFSPKVGERAAQTQPVSTKQQGHTIIRETQLGKIEVVLLHLSKSLRESSFLLGGLGKGYEKRKKSRVQAEGSVKQIGRENEMHVAQDHS